MNRPAAATAAARSNQQSRRAAGARNAGGRNSVAGERNSSARARSAADRRRDERETYDGESRGGVATLERPKPSARSAEPRRSNLNDFGADSDPVTGQAKKIIPSPVTPQPRLDATASSAPRTVDGVPLLQVGSATSRRPAGRRPTGQYRLSTGLHRPKAGRDQASAGRSRADAGRSRADTGRSRADTGRYRVDTGLHRPLTGLHRATTGLHRTRPRVKTAPVQRPARPTVPRRERNVKAQRVVALPKPKLSLKSLRPGPMLIDRIVRGRAWIPILGVLLLAVVAMRVEGLRIGMQHTKATELAAQLAATNGELQYEVSKLSDPTRIERVAKSYGMTMPSSSDVSFVTKNSSTSQAIKSISAPSGTTYTTTSAGSTASSDSSDSASSSSSDSNSSNSSATSNSASGSGSSDTASSGGSSVASSGSGTGSGSSSSGTGSTDSSTGSGTSASGGSSTSSGTSSGSGSSSASGGSGISSGSGGNALLKLHALATK